MIAATTLHVLLRAGGGQNFGGGGGGGGGGTFSGGGGGGGGFFFFPFFFGGGGGAGWAVSAIIVVFLVVALMRLLRAWTSSSTPRIGSGAPAGPPPPMTVPARGPVAPGPAGPYDDSRPVGVPDRFRGATLPGSAASAAGAGGVTTGLEQIRTHDPAFDDAAFVAQVERSFFVVQQAWTDLKPEMSRRVMADGLWQQHRVQIEQYQAQHRRNVLDSLAIGNADIVGAHSDATYDTITVRIHAACADYDVDTDSGKVVRGDRTVREWTENWVYQRSSQATTRPDGGTMSAKCPNCGAPLDVDLAGVCDYCKAPIMSGKYDWVLTRIDQV